MTLADTLSRLPSTENTDTINLDIRIDSGMNAWEIRGSLNKFPDFFRMGTFIDSTHMKL